MKPRVLVTGAGGMLGGRLAALLSASADVVAARHRLPTPGLPSVPFDLSSPQSVREALRASGCGTVVHCAAMADVGACERDPPAAWSINVTGTESLLAACARSGAWVIAVSTDLVCPGDRAFSREDDPVAPELVYARTKRAAEEAVLAAGGTVVRVPLIAGRGHGARGTVSEQIRWALEKGRAMRLFTDQFRTPTDPESIASALAVLIASPRPERFHLGGPERVSRHEIGLRVARAFGLREDLVEAAVSADATGPPRPADVSLDSSRAARELGYRPRPLDEAIAESRRGPAV